jgi:dethiobiotin synthetase
MRTGPHEVTGALNGSQSSRRPSRIFVTGTDTGVGKTVVASVLAIAWHADYWKPIQAGFGSDEPTDLETVRKLTGLPDDRFHPEAYRLTTPTSPHRAARIDGVTIEVDQLKPPIGRSGRTLLIEGAGGFLSPMNDDRVFADWANRIGGDVILVTPLRLGGVHATLAAVEAIAARDNLRLTGICFVGLNDEHDMIDYVVRRTRVESIGPPIPPADRLDRERIVRWATTIKSIDRLEPISIDPSSSRATGGRLR